MKFNQFRFVFFLAVILALSSCLGTTTDVTVSSNPCFSSLVFKANDSIPKLNTAVFSLQFDASLNDSVIVNLDSLPYKTRVDSVYPTFSFKSSAGAKLHFPLGYKYKKDSAVITGNDTIDFRKPIWVKNYASDAKTYRIYTIKVNVHQVDPELYQWNKAKATNINSINATSQKTVLLNDKFFYYLNDGTSSYLYTSTDGYSWGSATVSGLPVSTPLTDMIQFNSKLFLTRDGFNIYSSSNGTEWTKKSASDFTFKSLAFVLNGQLWAVVQSVSDATYHFANSNDGDVWSMVGAIPTGFPISDFASVSFSTITKQTKAVILGGYSVDGSQLKNNWSTEDGVYWVDFSTENHTLDTLSVGASVIRYDDKLFVFGTYNISNKNFYKVSVDEGLSWQIPDTLHNYLPAGLMSRNYQSVVVFKPTAYDKVNSAGLQNEIIKSNRIFIIGGKLGSTVYSDVWTGKLNRKNFLRQ